MILKRSAHQKLHTSNPGTIIDASNTIKALITRINRPSVKIVMGMVRIRSIGFKKKFNNVNTADTIMAFNILPTSIPGNKRLTR